MMLSHRTVAPRAGARIETTISAIGQLSPLSPPVRGRGLKLGHNNDMHGRGASPPVRGRGLKRMTSNQRRKDIMSPPVRGRGLKHGRMVQAGTGLCRPPCGGAD